MSCTLIQARLDDFIDDELEVSERHEVLAHLDGCPACRHEETELRSLVALAGKLPLHSANSTFSAIEGRLTPRDSSPARWRPIPLLAAAVLLVVASSMVTAWVLQPDPSSARPALAAGSEVPVDGLAFAVAELERSLAEKELDPELRDLVERNLEIIDRAIQETHEALDTDPQSDFLRNNLGKLQRQKVSVLRKLLNS